MTYKDQFVAELKLNGKILRIKDESVYLPFGSEYSLLLKNLNSRKASVNISIDGEDVLDGQSLILDANTSTELQGFLSNTTAKNRFKFIQKTKKIQEHRGDKADDGLIRIEFAYEKPQPEPSIVKIINEVHHTYYPRPWIDRYRYYGNIYDWNENESIKYTSAGGTQSAGELRSSCFYNSSDSLGVDGGDNVTYDCCNNVVADELGAPLDDEGITVKGSEINQDFRYGYIGALEPSQVIIINLKGSTETNTVVEKPITVQTKLTCPTCGTKSKSSVKFCSECGTHLG